ncbi:tyrosine-protein phosphatase non-receptor type 9-like [Ylistrum balloti]|uniref:tyrosine-protein phosphatase non-receptor type 9-like n=1 Tax=Ylistrum balloti TaxID=509963 RepID=UPI002905CE94|nr:tyrosine-protein phosphatase non-receptor type 9-like [Ylistrum balloti]
MAGCGGLSAEEEREVNGFLERVNKLREDENKDVISKNTAVKFLMARKFDRQRALELYLNHESTRRRESLVNIYPLDDCLKQELNTEKLTILPGRDRHGAAIALFTARLHTPACTSQQLVLKGLIYQLDAALESLETQRHGLVFIYDMTESKYNNFDYELSKKILNMLKGGYPARLKKVLIVTAPLWFKAPFKILRLFVREKLRDRVYTVSLGQLTQHIPKDSLPQQLGGSAPDTHGSWLQVCAKVCANQTADIDSYFMTSKKTVEQNSRESVSRRSLSSDMSDNLLISDIDSEESKETINEKHNCEDKEKEIQMNGDEKAEKEVTVEKEDSCVNNSGKRRRESDPIMESGSVKKTVDSAMDCINSEAIDQNLEIPKKKRPLSGSSNNMFEDSVHRPETGGLTLDELAEHCRNLKRKGMYQEYALIKLEPPMGTFNVSKAKYNLPKNRYSDVLCFDHSRVCLPIKEGDLSSDYINANYMDGYLQKQAYISTQGPLPKTFGDFWRMVWHCQVMVIVMTTKAIERGRLKCGQYWPVEEDAEDTCDEFLIINTGTEQHQDYTVTGLFLHNTKTDESRHLTHLQFTSWPDYGVPSSAAAFLDFLHRVRSCQADATTRLGNAWQGHPLGPPMVVHCSAGIGRTGTFMTIDICLRKLEDTGRVDVQETVRRIRSQRAFSIQMPDQYVFCHLGLIEHAMRQGKLQEIDWTGFDESDSDSE